MAYEDISYEKMVSLLAKPGEIILQQLDADDCHAMHMCLGIAGEIGEYVIADDPVNAKEELGDLEFYLEGLRQTYQITFDQVNGLPDIDSPLFNVIFGVTISAASGEVIDAVKKHILYRKTLDKQLVIEAMKLLEHAMKFERVAWSLTREDCLKANREKLLTGDKARYALGQYSDKQAQDRADKVV